MRFTNLNYVTLVVSSKTHNQSHFIVFRLKLIHCHTVRAGIVSSASSEVWHQKSLAVFATHI